MSHLRACQSCARHVRATETDCPFCSEALPAAGPAPRAPRQRLSRAKVLAFGVAVATSVAVGGSDGDGGGDSDAGPPDAGLVVPPYGTPSAELI